jgi:DNA processing protein
MEVDAAIAAVRELERNSHDNPQSQGRFSTAVCALGLEDPDYPAGLRRLATAPPALFVRGPGGPLPSYSRCVAVIGSRRASAEGLRLASDLARGLAQEGVCVVSGLALGIDAAAHQGALDGGGATLAVLASPVDEPTPRRNHGLAERVLRGGGWLVSERPPGARLQAWEFPRRNRLVAASVALVVVVEAGLRSGTMSTVEHALALGIDVAAVPGPAVRPSCRGSNALLRRGARWVECIDDVLSCLGREVAVARQGAIRDEDERAVLDGFVERSGSPGRWLEASSLPSDAARGALARLVCRGILRRLPGGLIGRVL